MFVTDIRNTCAEYGATTILSPNKLTITQAGIQLDLEVKLQDGSLSCPDVISFLDIWDGGLINNATFYGDLT
jgi:hypothetical protein